VLAEAAMVLINQFLIRHSDEFFGYKRPTDFRLEERHPELFPTNVRRRRWPGRRDQAAGGRGKDSDGAVFAVHFAGADAVS